MLSKDQARELVLAQLTHDFHTHDPSELIHGEIEGDWGWLFLYPNFGGGPSCGWLVSRYSGEMKHLSAVTSAEGALAEYTGELARRRTGSGGVA
jgi:hypothetical protein